MMADLRNDLAKARDGFLESDEGKKCCEGSAEGQFLKNRIEAAFLAGVNYMEKKKAESEKGEECWYCGSKKNVHRYAVCEKCSKK
jgi:hypothetical protein